MTHDVTEADKGTVDAFRVGLLLLQYLRRVSLARMKKM